MDFLEYIFAGQDESNKSDDVEIIEEKKPKYTVFDYINQINLKTKSLELIKGSYPGYMLTLHYSHDSDTLKYSEKFNQVLYLANDDIAYNYFYHSIPKGKRFTKWIKKTKEENIKEKLISDLIKLYNISKREALEIVNSLEAQ